MDGEQPSERQSQAQQVLAAVLGYIFSPSDWSIASHAYTAATALGTGLAARGDTPYPTNFNPNPHPGRFGPIGPRGKAPAKDVQTAIDWASDAFGLEKDYTRRIIYLESAHTFDPNITNPSGAKGLGQFFAGTWDAMMEYIIKNKPEAAREWLKKKGIITDDNASANDIKLAWRSATLNPTPGTWSTEIWRDADLNALATVAYADHNRAILNKLGVDKPTVGQIYALHLFGEGDGAKLIKALLNGQGNVSAADIVSPRSLSANHLSDKTVGQVMASLDGWMASMPDFNTLPPAKGLPAIAGTNATNAIGVALGARTDQNSNTPYAMGGNALGPTGGIDCSHYAWNNTIAIMREVNAKVGTQIYDINRMAGLLAPTAIAANGRLSASQYLALQCAGYAEYTRNDINNGRLAPGTLLFVDHGQGIEHVAQVSLDSNGHLQVSQSGGSNNHRVNNETYEEWMRKHASAKLTAINPFEVQDLKLRDTLEAAFKPTDPAVNNTTVAFKLAPPGHDVTIGDSYMVGIQSHMSLDRDNKKGEGGKTLSYLADRVEDNVNGGRILFHTSVWNDRGLTNVSADGRVTIDPSLRKNAERIATALEKNGGVWILPLDQTAYSRANNTNDAARISALANMYKEIADEHHVPTIDINKPGEVAYLHTKDIHIGPQGYAIAAGIVENKLKDLERIAAASPTPSPTHAPTSPIQTANAAPTPTAPANRPTHPPIDWAAVEKIAAAALKKTIETMKAAAASPDATHTDDAPDQSSAQTVMNALSGKDKNLNKDKKKTEVANSDNKPRPDRGALKAEGSKDLKIGETKSIATKAGATTPGNVA